MYVWKYQSIPPWGFTFSKWTISDEIASIYIGSPFEYKIKKDMLISVLVLGVDKNDQTWQP